MKTTSPTTFLHSSRFDILAKYIYAKFLDQNIDSNFGLDLYAAHLKVWNNYTHGDGKDGLDVYIDTFKQILASVKENGFDPQQSVVPVMRNSLQFNGIKLLNGGHRIAASLLYNKEVFYRHGEKSEGVTNVGYEYFKNHNRFVVGGLAEKWCDAIAFEYCKLKPNTYIVTIFPSATGDSQAHINAEKIIRDNSDIFYRKSLCLVNDGPFFLMRQMYLGEEWGGNFQNNFSGLRSKAKLCFQKAKHSLSNNPVVCYVITTDKKDTKTIKEKIREIYKIGNHSIHINDTQEETMRLARCLLNNNSIHFMNNCRSVYYKDFENYIQYFKNYIKENNLNLEDYCVTASSILSRYGVREGRDLDYLHTEENQITGHKEIHSHNEYGKNRYFTTYDDIIHNPLNHFYFEDVKYTSLSVVKKLKEKRGEEKDVVDIKLIDTLNYND